MFTFENYHDLKTSVMGCSRSLAMTVFNRSHMTFYNVQ